MKRYIIHMICYVVDISPIQRENNALCSPQECLLKCHQPTLIYKMQKIKRSHVAFSLYVKEPSINYIIGRGWEGGGHSQSVTCNNEWAKIISVNLPRLG